VTEVVTSFLLGSIWTGARRTWPKRAGQKGYAL